MRRCVKTLKTCTKRMHQVIITNIKKLVSDYNAPVGLSYGTQKRQRSQDPVGLVTLCPVTRVETPWSWHLRLGWRWIEYAIYPLQVCEPQFATGKFRQQILASKWIKCETYDMPLLSRNWKLDYKIEVYWSSANLPKLRRGCWAMWRTMLKSELKSKRHPSKMVSTSRCVRNDANLDKFTIVLRLVRRTVA